MAEVLPAEPKDQVVDIFFSYAPEDTWLFEELHGHLSVLLKQDGVRDWDRRRLVAGEDRAIGARNKLESADITVLLVSASFFSDADCCDLDMARSLQRHAAHETVLIPVVVRDVDLKSTALAKLRTLPRNDLAVTSWERRDAAWKEVAADVRATVERIRKEQKRRVAHLSGTGSPAKSGLHTERSTESASMFVKHAVLLRRQDIDDLFGWVGEEFGRPSLELKSDRLTSKSSSLEELHSFLEQYPNGVSGITITGGLYERAYISVSCGAYVGAIHISIDSGVPGKAKKCIAALEARFENCKPWYSSMARAPLFRAAALMVSGALVVVSATEAQIAASQAAAVAIVRIVFGMLIAALVLAMLAVARHFFWPMIKVSAGKPNR